MQCGSIEAYLLGPVYLDHARVVDGQDDLAESEALRCLNDLGSEGLFVGGGPGMAACVCTHCYFAPSRAWSMSAMMSSMFSMPTERRM
jgi:hypothetical protein